MGEVFDADCGGLNDGDGFSVVLVDELSAIAKNSFKKNCYSFAFIRLARIVPIFILIRLLIGPYF